MKSLTNQITIIVPVHRLDLGLRECVSSLAELHPPVKDVILVLDGIPLNSFAEFVNVNKKTFTIIESPIRRGAAAARNRGATHCESDLLLFIDSDVSVPANLAELVQAKFANDPELEAVFGSYDDTPGQKNLLSQYKNLMHHFIHQNSNERAATFWGACGSIRKITFSGANGFDETLNWLEDVDLGIRLWQRGAKIELDRSIQVKHWKKWTPISLFISDVFHRALPWARLTVKYRHLPNDLNSDIRSRISAVLVTSLLATAVFSTQNLVGLYLTVTLVIVLILLNHDFYRFLAKKRGFLFLIPALLWHWFYYLYSSIAFSVGIISSLLERSTQT